MIQEQSNLLLSRAWLIDERIGTHLYHQYIKGLLSLPAAKAAAAKKVDAKLNALASMQIGTYVSARKVKTKSGQNVAVMSVFGTLTKRGEMCSYGMRDYQNEIAALNENEEISAIVMDMEGPGGTVDGTNEFGIAVKNSKKPIVTFGDHMVASANYWVASQSKWIIGNKNNPTEFGSIGVLCVHEYWGKFIEENIGEIKIIRAPQSVDKARLNPIEQLSPELEKEVIADLKSMAQDFFSAVKKGRGSRLKESEKVWGTGKMYKLDEALSLGLIDATGTIMDAINKAAELAAPSTTSNTASNKKQSMNLKQVAKRASSFFQPKKKAAKAAAVEPAAAEEDTTPMWTEDMIFNTDGSGDGAVCLHTDDDGNDRQFETKVDNNQGNEPPTDPAITEDDNWSVVAEEAAAEEEEAKEQATVNMSVSKLNAALKKANASVKTLNAKVATLEAAAAAQKKKQATTPAGPETTVVSKGDKNAATKKQPAVNSWEKKRAAKLGSDNEEAE